MANNRFESLVFKSSRPQPMAQPPPRRILSSAGKRLSTILEHGSAPAQPPLQGSSLAKKFLRSRSPPPTSFEKQLRISEANAGSDTTNSSLEKEQRKGLTENKHIARRGGWKRLALIILLILLVALGLGLGLGLGLTRKVNSSGSSTPASDAISSSTSSNSADPSATGVPSSDPQFPVGSYSLVTFLSSAQTNCTANPSTWTCFPYTTYASNPSGALATFNWAISSSSSSSSSTHSITSTQDPFAITFASQPLSLLDAGQPSERYAFNLSMTKQVYPSGSITSDNAATTCFYNSTTFQASLYTKMAKSYSGAGQAGSSIDNGGGVGGSGSGASFPEWPFAVQVEQVAAGGQDVPNCYKTDNGGIGERITEGLAPEGAESECSCVYQNFDPPA